MAFSYEKDILSGSTDGNVIAIAATAAPGTLIHTSVASTTNFDLIYLWMGNVVSGAVLGVTSDSGTTFYGHQSTPGTGYGGTRLVLPGIPLRNSLVLRAYVISGGANAFYVFGWIIKVRAA